jgi:hypothetical protein
VRTPATDAPRTPSKHSVVYRTQAVIEADPARVWHLLVDLPGYATWNPWVIRAEGQAVPGGLVSVEVVMGRRTMRAKHVVLAVEPQARFCWRDEGWTTWFAYAQRSRTIERRADGSVLFSQEVLIDGALKRVAHHTMGKAIRDGMAAETAALKRHAE